MEHIDLLINQMDKKMIRKHNMLSQKDVEDVLGMESFGTVPTDPKIVIGQNKGALVMETRSVSQKAFRTICRHIVVAGAVASDIAPHSRLHRKECDYYEKNYKDDNNSNPWFSNRWFSFGF